MPTKPEVIAALAALAHPVRLDVFKALVEAGRRDLIGHGPNALVPFEGSADRVHAAKSRTNRGAPAPRGTGRPSRRGRGPR